MLHAAFYGPLMIFQHMKIFQDGVPKENWLTRVAIKKLFQLDWIMVKSSVICLIDTFFLLITNGGTIKIPLMAQMSKDYAKNVIW